MGNLTRDPELRYIPSGTAVSEIGLAVNDRVKKNNEWVDEVTFVDVTLWARTAEVANEYLSKGSSVLIEGRLKLDMWEKDGQKRSKLRVVADKMQMVGSKGGGQRGGGGTFQGQSSSYQGQSSNQGQPEYSDAVPSQPQNQPPAPSMPPNDEIPF